MNDPVGGEPIASDRGQPHQFGGEGSDILGFSV